MKINYVVIENKTRINLRIYCKGVANDKLHIIVISGDQPKEDLLSYNEYLIKPGKTLRIDVDSWTRFGGINLNLKKLLHIWIKAQEIRKPSEGTHHLILQEQLN